MSVDLFRPSNTDAVVRQTEIEEVQTFRDADEWSPERFAREQIRGLVRQVFFSSIAPQVRQVVFSAIEATTDVAQLCRQVGETLALEIRGSVAVLTREGPTQDEAQGQEFQQDAGRPRAVDPNPLPLREVGRQVGGNFWLLTEGKVLKSRNEAPTAAALYSRLCELRGEFDYSIVHGPPAGQSSEVAALGQLTDGIVLVLTAHQTRRAAALKTKEMLEGARTRILGVVLSERTFPIPAALYRRL